MSEFITIESPAIERTALLAKASAPVAEYLNSLVAELIVSRQDEINAHLARFGIATDRILLPEWQVMVRAGDIELQGSPEQKRDAVVDMMARVNESIRRNEELTSAFGRTSEESAR